MSRPPLPREHGAWVVLYAPLVITLVAYPPADREQALLLTPAVTGLFLGRNALGLLHRARLGGSRVN
ncbi:MAG: YwiC-like family protein [Armatimonadetes bacterium]|nr:YwiC-like family protein [Armatimonadota bacterium]